MPGETEGECAVIDFDYNATTPVKPSVREAMEPFLNAHYGNPSSVHRLGQRARAAVESARETIARAVGTDAESVVVTASGSEANGLALRGTVRPPYDEREILSTPVEHSSVLETLRWFEKRGSTVQYAPVDEDGRVDVDWFRERIEGTVDLVSVMAVNNETGVVFPVGEIGEICREYGVAFHVDAVQALGKISVNVGEYGAAMVSLSAHKIGGPKGAGALIVDGDYRLEPLIFGGHQERDRRGGTENVAATAGFAEAIKSLDLDAMRRTRRIRDSLEENLLNRLEDVRVVGQNVRRAPNTTGLLLSGVEGEDVVRRLDMAGIAVATGAACTSGSPQPSHVIQAMDLPEGYAAENFLRLSMPPEPSAEEGRTVVETMVKNVRTLRERSSSEEAVSPPTSVPPDHLASAGRES